MSKDDYQIYNVAIIHQPTVAKDEKPKAPKMIAEPKYVIAKSEQSAATKVLLETGELVGDIDKDELKVVVSPF
jgi:hypothetical protein